MSKMCIFITLSFFEWNIRVFSHLIPFSPPEELGAFNHLFFFLTYVTTSNSERGRSSQSGSLQIVLTLRNPNLSQERLRVWADHVAQWECFVHCVWLSRMLVWVLIRWFMVRFCRYDSSSMSLLLHVLQLRNLSKATVRDGYKVWVCFYLHMSLCVVRIN